MQLNDSTAPSYGKDSTQLPSADGAYGGTDTDVNL